jgi:hypothetical protein
MRGRPSWFIGIGAALLVAVCYTLYDFWPAIFEHARIKGGWFNVWFSLLLVAALGLIPGLLIVRRHRGSYQTATA